MQETGIRPGENKCKAVTVKSTAREGVADHERLTVDVSNFRESFPGEVRLC